jgi:hypothetical protein
MAAGQQETTAVGLPAMVDKTFLMVLRIRV